MRRPSREGLLAVCAAFPKGDQADYGRWIPSRETEKGTLTWPWWMPSDEILLWHNTLYAQRVIVQFDWMASAWAERMRSFEADPDLLDAQDLDTVLKVLTTVSRANRFDEGYLGKMLESGLLHAAMRRLETLAEESAS
ncbi:MAG: DUF6508 domain-containing protein [Coriobacteriia bacterium]|nr:DUF6508 domain-containing protein [Coriobacteriia bacterium]